MLCPVQSHNFNAVFYEQIIVKLGKARKKEDKSIGYKLGFDENMFIEFEIRIKIEVVLRK